MEGDAYDLARKPGGYLVQLSGMWDMHTQSVSSEVLQIRFRPTKTRLVGLGFDVINPVLIY